MWLDGCRDTRRGGGVDSTVEKKVAVTMEKGGQVLIGLRRVSADHVGDGR